ncbi:MAG TPA: hypothetical protein PK771_13060, partial [Spirochaetota bacterium]|nr:hypothetical protein [Spirochaetota bacterium]
MFKKVSFNSLMFFVLFLISCQNQTPDGTTTTDGNKTSTAINYVVDHNSLNADSIPDVYLSQVKNLKVYFEHASVGSNIVEGLQNLKSGNQARYSYSETNWSDNARGNPGFDEKVSGFKDR